MNADYMKSNPWKQMYFTLFQGIIDAHAMLPMNPENCPAAERLNQALQDAEELYLQDPS